MSQKIQIEITGDSKDLERALGRAGKSTQTFGEKVAKGAKVAGLALGAGLLVLGKKSSDAASNLNESMNAVSVVFGRAADKIKAFSNIAATEAGLSARAFNELVTPIGAALQNVGLGADKAASASINLAKRAADMASVFNVDVSEAMEAIQAGLRGEADPLERFGVGLSDAAVTAKALKMGLGKTADALGPNAKAQARLALIMEQTNRVSGDFKRTSDDLANKQRINAAEAENTAATFGQALLPAMEMFQSILRSTLGFLAKHETLTKGLVAGLGVLAAALLAASVAQTLLNLAMLANPVGAIVLGIIALGVAIVVAWKRFETFRNIVTGAIDFVREHWRLLLAILLGPLGVAIGLAIKHFGTVKKVAVTAFNAIRDAIGFVIDKVRSVVNWLRDKLGSPAVRQAIVNALVSPFNRVRDAVQFVIDKVQGLIDIINRIPSPGDIFGAVSGFVTGATGITNHKGGLALVGERGPELLNLPRGSDVIPLRPAGAHTAVAAGAPTVINFHFGNYVGDRRELMKTITQEVQRISRGNGGRKPF